MTPWKPKNRLPTGRGVRPEAVQPIHELLARIRHDREFGKARFEIGYFDRRENAIRRVAFYEIVFPDDRGRLFEVLGETGERRQIPFHRVREVYRNNELIWERPKAPGQAVEGPRGGVSL